MWGCHDLGVVLAKGTGAPCDEAQAEALIKKACDSGLPEACANGLVFADQRPPGEGAFLVGTSRPHPR